MPTLPENKTSSRLEWLAAGFVSVAIVWLHFHFWRNAGGLWRDEVNLVNLASSPSLAAMTHDSFPVLMPLLVKIWTSLGVSDAWLRLLGLCAGLAIPAAYWAVARATRRPPLFSLVLFALNSLLICYGDSLRGYGIGSALIVFALAAMWSFLKNPTWRRGGIVALAATLSVQALYQNALLFFAICLGGFAVCARQKNFSAAQKIFCAGVVAAMSLLPYYASLATLPQAAVELRRGFSPFITSLNFEMATGFPFAGFTSVWKILAVLTIAFALFSLRRPPPPETSEQGLLPLFAGVTLAAVAALFIGFLWFAAVAVRPWYFLPPLALTAACFDFGISLSLLPRLVRTAAFGILIGTVLISLTYDQSDLRGHFTNVDRLAARVTAEAAPQDFVVVTPWFCGISFARYFHGPTAWETLPPLTDHRTHRYDLMLAQMQNTNALTPVLEKISATLRTGHRVWIVGLMDMPAPNAGEPQVLPPPPLPDSGWSDTAYTGSWAARTAFFLSRYGESFQPVSTDDQQLYFQENLHLLMAQGWKTNAP